MIKLKQALVVEGKYDKINLASFIDAVILVTDGFKIFKDEKKKELIKFLAKKQGIVVLTDSDAAGQLIRLHVKSIVSEGEVFFAYIPKIFGKERRKTCCSKEGTIGVEGMEESVILDALKRSGIFFKQKGSKRSLITNLDLMENSLFGRENSNFKRKRFLNLLGLPDFLSSKQLLSFLNANYTRDEFAKEIEKLNRGLN